MRHSEQSASSASPLVMSLTGLSVPPSAERSSAGRDKAPDGAPVACMEALIRQWDALEGHMLSPLSRHELAQAEQMRDGAEKLLMDGPRAPLSAAAASGVPLLLGMRLALLGNAAAGLMERGRILLDYIGDVLANDERIFSSDRARRAGNVLAVATRTGVIVALTTVLRQMVGFVLERHLQGLDGADAHHCRMISGIGSLLLGPALNLAGVLRDERTGTATTASRCSRMGVLLLSSLAILTAAVYQPQRILGATLASVGPQMACYTLARDILQTFFPLRGDSGMNGDGLVCASVLYGIAQMLLSEGLLRLAPRSGAEFLISSAARAADLAPAAAAALALAEPDLLHDLLRSAMNSAVEVFDELQRPFWMRYFAADPQDRPEPEKAALMSGLHTASAQGMTAKDNALPPERAGMRIGLARPRVGSGNWPTSAQFADNLLTTSAMRTSIFEAVVAISATIAVALENTSLCKDERYHAVSLLVGGLVTLAYPGFAGAHLTCEPSGSATRENTDITGASQ
ncbi:hypothetical protein [Martelella alba]|uniref:Uncharacterized protein n=1 Tax=Martelella alba TaxID=2590451 RepID=A0ABY2SUS4_9HYPH|nr:hypothetical protein [Martelella alba]TKI08886.1 hypothetical protein FCN80_02225 [Martelella alba]